MKKPPSTTTLTEFDTLGSDDLRPEPAKSEAPPIAGCACQCPLPRLRYAGFRRAAANDPIWITLH